MEQNTTHARSGEEPAWATPALGVVPRVVSLVCAGLLIVIMSLVVLELVNQPAANLTEPALANLETSGVGNPVTAVLLNYRAFDTWLELGVLLLAIMAALVILRSADLRGFGNLPQPPEVLAQLVGLYVPLVVIIGAYVLWQGTSAPGGAFQAGALWAAAGVIMRLAGVGRLHCIPGWLLRLGCLAAFGGFTLVGLFMLLHQGAFLRLPEAWSTHVIFWLEVIAALSIAITLWALYTTIYPATEARRQRTTPDSTTGSSC